MPNEQLKNLYNEFNPKLNLAKDYNEFEAVMQNENSRKDFFNTFNKELNLAKDFNEFEDVLGLKKKDISQEPLQSSVIPTPFTSGLPEVKQPEKNQFRPLYEDVNNVTEQRLEQTQLQKPTISSLKDIFISPKGEIENIDPSDPVIKKKMDIALANQNPYDKNDKRHYDFAKKAIKLDEDVKIALPKMQTVGKYLSDLQITPEQINLPPNFNPDKILTNSDIERYNTILGIKNEIYSKKENDAIEKSKYHGVAAALGMNYWRSFRTGLNQGVESTLRSFDGAEKFIMNDVFGFKNFGGGFKNAADWVKENAVEPYLPLEKDANYSQMAFRSLGQMIPFLAELSLPIQEVIKIGQSTLQVPKMASIMFGQAFTEKYSEESSQNKPFQEKLTTSLKEGGKGALTGYVFTGIGEIAGKTAQLLAKDKVAQTLINVAVNSGGFAGFTGLEQLAQGKPEGMTDEEWNEIQKKNIISSGILGGVLGVPSIGKAILGASYNRFTNTSNASIEKINQMNITPEKSKKIIENIAEINDKLETIDKTNVEEIQKLKIEKQVLENTFLVNTATKAILLDPEKAIKSVNESTDTEFDKKQQIDKINEVVAENHPNIKKADEISIKISENNSKIEQIQSNIENGVGNKITNESMIKSFEKSNKELENAQLEILSQDPTEAIIFGTEIPSYKIGEKEVTKDEVISYAKESVGKTDTEKIEIINDIDTQKEVSNILTEKKGEQYDSKNITRISSKIEGGEKPIETKPIEEGGGKEVDGGRIFQAPSEKEIIENKGIESTENPFKDIKITTPEKDYDLSEDNQADFEYDLMQSLGRKLGSARFDYIKKGDAIIRVKGHTPNWDNFKNDIEENGIKAILNITVGDYNNKDFRSTKTNRESFENENPNIKVIDIKVDNGESLSTVINYIKTLVDKENNNKETKIVSESPMQEQIKLQQNEEKGKGQGETLLKEVETPPIEKSEVNSIFAPFEKIINESKNLKDAYNKVKSIKNVPKEVADAFSEKYNPNKDKKGDQAFETFYNEVKSKEPIEITEIKNELKKETDEETINKIEQASEVENKQLKDIAKSVKVKAESRKRISDKELEKGIAEANNAIEQITGKRKEVSEKVVEPKLEEKEVQFNWLGDTEIGTEISRENGKVKIKGEDGTIYNIKESDVIILKTAADKQKAINKIQEGVEGLLNKLPIKKNLLPEEKTKLVDDIKNIISGISELTVLEIKNIIKTILPKYKLSKEDINDILNKTTLGLELKEFSLGFKKGILKKEEVISSVIEKIKETKLNNKLSQNQLEVLLTKIKNAESDKQVKKILSYIDKVVEKDNYISDIETIDKNKKQIKSFQKKNEYTGNNTFDVKNAVDNVMSITKDMLNEMPDNLFNEYKDITSQLATKKVSDITGLKEISNKLDLFKENIYDNDINNEISNAETIKSLNTIIEKEKLLSEKEIKTYADLIDYKKSLSILQRSIKNLIHKEGIIIEDGVFKRNGEIITEFKDIQEQYKYLEEMQSIESLISEINKQNPDAKFTKEKYLEYEKKVKDNAIAQIELNKKNISFNNFDKAHETIIKETLNLANKENLEKLNISDVDTFNKVVEQLLNGNMSSKILDIRNNLMTLEKVKQIERLQKDIILNSKLTKALSSLKDKFLKQVSTGHIEFLDKKYYQDLKGNRPLYNFLDQSLMNNLRIAEKKEKELNKYLKNQFLSTTGKQNAKQKKSEAIVQMLGELIRWQINIPNEAIPKIKKLYNISENDNISHLFELELILKDPKINDVVRSKINNEELQMIKDVWEELKSRNKGKPIIFKKEWSKSKILSEAKRLLTEKEFNHYKEILKGYDSLKQTQKENAIRQNIPFEELRFYIASKAKDRILSEFEDNKTFLENVTNTYTHPVSKSGNVNKLDWYPHLRSYNATEMFKRTANTAIKDKYIRDTYRALLSGFESAKKEINDTDQMKFISSIQRGIKDRMMNEFAIGRYQPENNITKIAMKAIHFSNRYLRTVLLAPERVIGEIPSNMINSIMTSDKPFKTIKDISLFSKEQKEVRKFLEEEMNLSYSHRLIAEEVDMTALQKKVWRGLSFPDRNAKQQMAKDKFENEFFKLTGETFDYKRYFEDAQYKIDFKKEIEDAKSAAHQNNAQIFPSDLSFERLQNKGWFQEINNTMMSFSMQNSVRGLYDLRGLTKGDLEYRYKALKGLTGNISANIVYGTYQTYRSIFMGLLAGQVLSLLGDDNKSEEVTSYYKEKLKTPLQDVIIKELIQQTMLLPTDRFGNATKTFVGGASMIINETIAKGMSESQIRKKLPELAKFNEFINETYYIKPPRITGYTQGELKNTISLFLPAASNIIFDGTRSIGEIYNIIDKGVRGEELNEEDFKLFNLIKLTNGILFGANNLIWGAGSIDALTKKLSSSKEWDKKSKNIKPQKVHSEEYYLKQNENNIGENIKEEKIGD